MNTTSHFEVGGLLSSMSARGVEKQLSKLPGVAAVEANAVAGSASVTFDPERVSAQAIRSKIEECGYHCAGEATPRHVCAPHAGTAHAHPSGARRDGRDHARHGPRRRHGRARDGTRHAQPLLGLPRLHAAGLLKRAEGLALEPVDGFTNIDGMGAEATLRGARTLLGNRRLMDTNRVDLAGLEADSQRLRGQGRTVVHVAHGARLIGLIAIADAVRPTSAATIEALHAKGVQVAMLTGDNRATAERVARQLGIDIVLADVLPGDKAAKVKELQAQGKKVGMVGDGINDAPALTQADVGFAIGAGTDVAMESADVVLMKSDPFDVVGAIELSRATLRKMHQNLWWAVAYNVVAFPLAAGVFYPFTISPEVAAIAMSGSSALVAINALMLKRTRLTGIRRVSAGHHPTAGAARTASAAA